MHLEIHADHAIKVKDTFRDYALSIIESLAETYLTHIAMDEISANIELNEGKNSHSCKVTIHGGHHTIFRSDATETGNISEVFELAITKLKNNLRKHKNKFDKYHKNQSKDSKHNITKHIASYAKFSDEEPDISSVISSQEQRLEILNSIEAVMRIDLENINGLAYIDAETGHMSFVYKRVDGNLSFIDTGKKL